MKDPEKRRADTAAPSREIYKKFTRKTWRRVAKMKLA